MGPDCPEPHADLRWHTVITPSVLSYIPSPPSNGISIGPLRLHVYGLLIACGIAAAVWLSQRRWDKIGGKSGTMAMLALWGVPGGLIGARLYSLITSWQVDTQGHPLWALEIWRGGLGIWGGVIGGIAAGAIGAHRARLPIRPLLDCVAPAFALAQAIGRWGNYFNQELFGRPSTLPWALKIDAPARAQLPARYQHYTTFQPTFLYECIWDLAVVGLVILVERRFRIKRGYLITAYASFYTFGRFWVEYLRIDDAHRWLGLRLNDWTSIVVFAASTIILLTMGRARPGDERAGDPLPATVYGPTAAPTDDRADDTTDEADHDEAGDQAGERAGEPLPVAVRPAPGSEPAGPTDPSEDVPERPGDGDADARPAAPPVRTSDPAAAGDPTATASTTASTAKSGTPATTATNYPGPGGSGRTPT
jgi:prolipoprotein diacylglyceryl transferase